jgi:3-oxoacyl-[acyl-carrier protein] reductase
MRFKQKNAVVTGSASGFGEAIAASLAAEGANVVVADIDEAGGRRVVGAITDAGGRAVFTRTDVSSATNVKGMIDAAVTQFGGLDILVNNAGFSHLMMPLWELPEEEYERVFATNVRGVFLGCKYAVPVMQGRGGVIINTSSRRPQPTPDRHEVSPQSLC